MQTVGADVSTYGLEEYGIYNPGTVYWNLRAPQLYEQIVRRGEGAIADQGPIVVSTGRYTGRTPKDRFIVEEPGSAGDIWWGAINQPISPEHFDGLYRKIVEYTNGRDLFVFDGYAGADARYRMPIRVINEYAWHNLFCRNMFINEPDPEKLESFVPQFTVIDMPNCFADPAVDGTRTETFILLNFSKRMIVVGGSEYSGEMKKGIFSTLNYYLPLQGVLTMHCSANYGRDENDVALFFGLSGTGKTTLSSDSTRTLIGDDEHGWSADGVFNIEGGCYAKIIRLDPQGEPEIYQTTQRFGTILENVVRDGDTCMVDLDDGSYTENTRSSYPISFVSNASATGMAGHPRHIIFLTADAFGVLPPISKLTGDQALYHFLSGYTAKIAGTELGVIDPQPNFSTCFGAPFMPLFPGVYAGLLGQKIDQHGVQVWLVNTGWTGGSFGTGSRMKLAHTRRMVHAALNDELHDAPTRTEPFFGLEVPLSVPGVPDDILDPRRTWADGAAYDAQAARLAAMFVENFRQYEDQVPREIVDAGPPRVETSKAA